MAGESWRLEGINSAFYLDAGGNPVNGFEVRITLLPFNSYVTFNVPTDDPDTIAQIAQQRLDNRIKLEEMANGGQA